MAWAQGKGLRPGARTLANRGAWQAPIIATRYEVATLNESLPDLNGTRQEIRLDIKKEVLAIIDEV